MRATFFQKVILTALAAFVAAGLIQFYKVFIAGADESINGAYRHQAGISADH